MCAIDHFAIFRGWFFLRRDHPDLAGELAPRSHPELPEGRCTNRTEAQREAATAPARNIEIHGDSSAAR
jgi:hypothetical protein